MRKDPPERTERPAGRAGSEGATERTARETAATLREDGKQS